MNTRRIERDIQKRGDDTVKDITNLPGSGRSAGDPENEVPIYFREGMETEAGEDVTTEELVDFIVPGVGFRRKISKFVGDMIGKKF